MQKPFYLMLTCEHASNVMPDFAKTLDISKSTLNSHKGFDIGAKLLYDNLVKTLHPDFYSAGTYSRLFIDLNRSLWNKSIFSAYYNEKGTEIQEQAIAYYKEYRQKIEDFINSIASKNAEKKPVLHIGMHSFTSVWQDKIRHADIGLLYDPASLAERRVVEAFSNTLKSMLPKFCIRKNYPYKGISDGLTTALRKICKEKGILYAGIEVECNQNIFK